MSEDARPPEPSERFGPNGAVMGAMSEAMQDEYERADDRLDFQLGEAIPTVIGVVTVPFVIGSEIASSMGASLGVLVLGVVCLYASIDLVRIKNAHPSDWREHWRWGQADWRTKIMQVVLAACVPLGVAAVTADLFGF